jgi:hypothetical protein
MRVFGERRGGHTEMLIISLAMVVRNNPWNRKGGLRVCSQETESMDGTCFVDGPRLVFRPEQNSYYTVSRLRKYRVRTYLLELKGITRGKKEKKTITSRGEKEKRIHTWNKQQSQKMGGELCSEA